ncbi:hypothetical protein KKA24_02840 [Patescibacteria group bacterium]|nr:hypothetical protein [Patescibacteria group bacterium]
MINEEISKILFEIRGLLDIKGDSAFRIRAYDKAIEVIKNLDQDLGELYKKEGIAGLKKIKGIGESTSQKIEEYIKKKKVKYYEELIEDTRIQQIITYFFETKGVSLKELKNNARKRKIVYSRYTKPAKQLLELAGSIEKAKKAIKKVADWASSRKLDYTIETVFKKWLELDSLKPKEIVKKPFFRKMPMIWSEAKKKWFVIDRYGEWLEFAGKEDEITWEISK